MFVLIYGILVAVVFYRTAKARGLSTGKWGSIGFFGGIASYLAFGVVIVLIETQIIDRTIIRAPGYVFFPASALVMYLVYRKWIYPLPPIASQSRDNDK